MKTRDIAEIAIRKHYPAAWSWQWAHALPEMSKEDLKDELKRRVREIRAAEWYGAN